MIITLIGSARFELNFIEANKELTLRGHRVFSLGCMPRDSGGKDWYTEGQKQVLDMVHLAKMSDADAILLLGDGYVGQSTGREITWAWVNGMVIVPEWSIDTPDTKWDRLEGALLERKRWTLGLYRRVMEMYKEGRVGGNIAG